jgi:predicted PurR-regulated permease PerM
MHEKAGGTAMSSLPEQLAAGAGGAFATSTWLRRFLIALTILAWMVIVAIVYSFFGIIGIPIILLLLAAIVAYILSPLVKGLSRFMPRALAITLVYLLVFGALFFMVYFMLTVVIAQLTALIHTVQIIFQDYQKGKYSQFTSFLSGVGVTQEAINSTEQTMIGSLGGAAGNLIPLLGNLFTYFIYMVVITSVSVYILVGGPRVNNWLKNGTPLRYRAEINFFMETVDKEAGGYLRGQILLSAIMAVLVTIGAYVIGVPSALLIGIIVFIFEFIPQIGAYISGLIGILIAASHGWQTALIYAVFVTVLQGVLDGQILAPRILGKSVGVNPAVSLIMLFIFGALFGLWGAFLSAPILGVIQVFIIVYWKEWKRRNPAEFPEVVEQKEPKEISPPEQGVVAT